MVGGEGHGHDQLKYFNGAQRKKNKENAREKKITK